MPHENAGNSRKLNTEMLSKPCTILISVWLPLVFAAACFAQVDRSALNGTVTDPTGRVLPGVEVVAVQDSTGLRRATVTAGGGTYEIPELPVGTYNVTFSHDGFEALTFSGVEQVVRKTR